MHLKTEAITHVLLESHTVAYSMTSGISHLLTKIEEAQKLIRQFEVDIFHISGKIIELKGWLTVVRKN